MGWQKRKQHSAGGPNAYKYNPKSFCSALWLWALSQLENARAAVVGSGFYYDQVGENIAALQEVAIH